MTDNVSTFGIVYSVGKADGSHMKSLSVCKWTIVDIQSEESVQNLEENFAYVSTVVNGQVLESLEA
jgi:hypothetical protein